MCNKIILSNYIKNRQCKCAYELFVIYTQKALRIKKKKSMTKYDKPQSIYYSILLKNLPL